MKILLLITWIFIAVTADAQDIFQQLYGRGMDEICESVQQTSDSGYIFTGYTQSFGAGSWDVYQIKTNKDGDMLWSKTYGGGNDDRGMCVVQTTDGGYITTGSTKSFGAGNKDVYLIKTDSLGSVLWSRTYGGSNEDIGNYVQQTSDGGYIITGSTYSFGAGTNDCYLIKTDSNGDTLWTRTFGGVDFEEGNAVQQTNDGGYIVTGRTMSFGVAGGGTDVYLIKTDASGNLLWTRTFGGAMSESGYSVQQTTDNGYIITGYTWSYGAGNDDVYLIKTDENGDLLWSKAYGESSNQIGYSVKQTLDEGYVITGSAINGNDNDVYLIKTDTSGNIIWSKTFGTNNEDYGHSVQQTFDGGYIIAGNGAIVPMGLGSWDIYLIKTDSLGNSGCYEAPFSTVTTNAATSIDSGAVVGFGATVGNPGTITGNPSSNDTTLCSTAGTEQLTYHNEGITIYPNPTEGKFQIQSSKSQVEMVEVYDLFGRKLLESKEPEIDMRGYAKAVYFVRVGEVVRKLVLH